MVMIIDVSASWDVTLYSVVLQELTASIVRAMNTHHPDDILTFQRSLMPLSSPT
jgi:hypothetical protein